MRLLQVVHPSVGGLQQHWLVSSEAVGVGRCDLLWPKYRRLLLMQVYLFPLPLDM